MNKTLPNLRKEALNLIDKAKKSKLITKNRHIILMGRASSYQLPKMNIMINELKTSLESNSKVQLTAKSMKAKIVEKKAAVKNAYYMTGEIMIKYYGRNKHVRTSKKTGKDYTDVFEKPSNFRVKIWATEKEFKDKKYIDDLIRREVDTSGDIHDGDSFTKAAAASITRSSVVSAANFTVAGGREVRLMRKNNTVQMFIQE